MSAEWEVVDTAAKMNAATWLSRTTQDPVVSRFRKDGKQQRVPVG